MRYYLHVEDGGRLFDPQGKELPDDAAAISAGRHLAESLSRSPIYNREQSVRVVDSAGRTVATIPFGSRS